MNKARLPKKLISIFLLVMCLFRTGICAEYRAFSKLNSVATIKTYELPPQIIKKRTGKNTDIRASDDFVSGISHHYEMKFRNKNELLSTVEVMLSDKENTAKQTEIFRQIEQTDLLTRKEKIDWLKPRINILPAPFTMLLAKLVSSTDLVEAFKWKVLSQLRMKIDAAKCKDQSTNEGVRLIEFYYLDSIFDSMVAYYDKHGYGSKMNNQFLNQEFSKRSLQAIKSALQYHSAHAYQIDYPYWLNNHGMSHIKMLQDNRHHASKKEIFMTTLYSKKKEAQLIGLFQQALKTN